MGESRREMTSELGKAVEKEGLLEGVDRGPEPTYLAFP